MLCELDVRVLNRMEPRMTYTCFLSGTQPVKGVSYGLRLVITVIDDQDIVYKQSGFPNGTESEIEHARMGERHVTGPDEVELVVEACTNSSRSSDSTLEKETVYNSSTHRPACDR